MKRIFLVLALITISASSWAQVKSNKCLLRMIEPKESELLVYEDSLVRVQFEPYLMGIFMNVIVSNLSEKTISIDWNDFVYARKGEVRVPAFGDESYVTNGSKAISKILPGTKLEKQISERGFIDTASPLYDKRNVKKYGPVNLVYVLPIEVNGNVNEYKFDIIVTAE